MCIPFKMDNESLSQGLELANLNTKNFEETATKPLPEKIIEGGEIVIGYPTQYWPNSPE